MRLQTGVLLAFLVLHIVTTSNGDGHQSEEGGGNVPHHFQDPEHKDDPGVVNRDSNTPWKGLMDCVRNKIMEKMFTDDTAAPENDDGDKDDGQDGGDQGGRDPGNMFGGMPPSGSGGGVPPNHGGGGMPPNGDGMPSRGGGGIPPNNGGDGMPTSGGGDGMSPDGGIPLPNGGGDNNRMFTGAFGVDFAFQSPEQMAQMTKLASMVIKQCLKDMRNDSCRNENDTAISMIARDMLPRENRTISCPPREKDALMMMDRACGVYQHEKPWKKITGCVWRHMYARKKEMAEEMGNMTKCPREESSESISDMTDEETDSAKKEAFPIIVQCLKTDRDGGCKNPNIAGISKIIDYHFREKDECNKEPSDEDAKWMMDDACGDMKPWGKINQCLWSHMKAKMMEKMKNMSALSDEKKMEGKDEMEGGTEHTKSGETQSKEPLERSKCDPSESESKPTWTDEEKASARSAALPILKQCLINKRLGGCKDPKNDEISKIVDYSFRQMEASGRDPSSEDAENMMDKACGAGRWEKMTRCLYVRIKAKMDTLSQNVGTAGGDRMELPEGGMTEPVGFKNSNSMRGEETDPKDSDLMRQHAGSDMGSGINDPMRKEWTDKQKETARKHAPEILTGCLMTERTGGCTKPNNTEISNMVDAALTANLTDDMPSDEKTKRWMDAACGATALGLGDGDGSGATNLHISVIFFLITLTVVILHF